MKYIVIIAILGALIVGWVYSMPKAENVGMDGIQTLTEPVDIDKAIQSGGITLD